MTGRPGRVERGSVTVELVLIAPVLLALLMLTILAGRIVLAGGTVEQVAAAGARAASLTRSAAEASTAATTAVRQSIAEQHLQCQDVSVSVDTTGFRVPLGQPASVAVTVSCRVRLSDLTLPQHPAHAPSPTGPSAPWTPTGAESSGSAIPMDPRRSATAESRHDPRHPAPPPPSSRCGPPA